MAGILVKLCMAANIVTTVEHTFCHLPLPGQTKEF